MYQEFGISEKIEKMAIECEKELEAVFKRINEIALKNSIKVLKAFQRNQVSEMHFGR